MPISINQTEENITHALDVCGKENEITFTISGSNSENKSWYQSKISLDPETAIDLYDYIGSWLEDQYNKEEEDEYEDVEVLAEAIRNLSAGERRALAAALED